LLTLISSQMQPSTDGSLPSSFLTSNLSISQRRSIKNPMVYHGISPSQERMTMKTILKSGSTTPSCSAYGSIHGKSSVHTWQERQKFFRPPRE
jgi:hypothetical protein